MSSTFLLRVAGAAVAAVTVLPAVPALAVGGPPEGVGRGTAPVVRGLDLACPDGRVKAGGFGDVAGTHAAAIDCLAFYGVTKGAADGTFGSGKAVTRAQMATFLTRVLERADVAVPTDAPDAFSDDDGSTHEASLDALAALGVVNGAGDGTVSPEDAVRRDQMASFMFRLLELLGEQGLDELADTVEDFFEDTKGSVHRGPINALAGLGIAAGRTQGVFDPSNEVRRDQMATFLMRLIDRLVEKGDVDVPVSLHLSAEEVSPGDVVTATVTGDGITAASIAGCGFDEVVATQSAAPDGTTVSFQFLLPIPDAWPVEAEPVDEEEPVTEEAPEQAPVEEGSQTVAPASAGDVEDECEFTVFVTLADGEVEELEGELEFREADEAEEAEGSDDEADEEESEDDESADDLEDDESLENDDETATAEPTV